MMHQTVVIHEPFSDRRIISGLNVVRGEKISIPGDENASQRPKLRLGLMLKLKSNLCPLLFLFSVMLFHARLRHFFIEPFFPDIHVRFDQAFLNAESKKKIIFLFQFSIYYLHVQLIIVQKQRITKRINNKLI